MRRWLLVALVSVSGCAFSLDGPDPRRPRDEPPRCDTSKILVGLDGVMVAALGLAALTTAAVSPADALLPVAGGALFLTSAIRGNGAVNRCRAAREDYLLAYERDRLEDDEADDAARARAARARRAAEVAAQGQAQPAAAPGPAPAEVPPASRAPADGRQPGATPPAVAAPSTSPAPARGAEPSSPPAPPAASTAPGKPVPAAPDPGKPAPAAPAPGKPAPAAPAAPVDAAEDGSAFWREAP